MSSIRTLLLATVAAVGALTMAPTESKAQYYYGGGGYYARPYYGGYGGGYGYNRGYYGGRGYGYGGYGYYGGRRGYSVSTPWGGFSYGRGGRWW